MAAAPPAEPVTGADVVREDLAERSQTIGGIANRLDSFAVELGDWRVSAFDVIFAVGAVLLVLAFA
ncbi:MAG: hypothetical protein K2Q29_06045, partial [Sphingomonadales bacterium]|nr:hypothetical protein [Sphingomonadales bacterium]